MIDKPTFRTHARMLVRRWPWGPEEDEQCRDWLARIFEAVRVLEPRDLVIALENLCADQSVKWRPSAEQVAHAVADVARRERPMTTFKVVVPVSEEEREEVSAKCSTLRDKLRKNEAAWRLRSKPKPVAEIPKANDEAKARVHAAVEDYLARKSK